MQLTRRAWIGGTAAALAGDRALAAPSIASLQRHPAFRIWDAPKKAVHAPMSSLVANAAGEPQPLGQWLGGQAAVVVTWATWCTPCLAEMPDLARLQHSLREVGAKTVIRPIHGYDDANLNDAQALMRKLGAGDLETVQASQSMELAALRIFGKSPVERTRTSLPALLLVKSNGAIVGTRIGSPDPEKGQPPYWRDPRTLDFLTQLGTLA
jgi:thiol-disulfide isomerase/thioredoxin